MNNSARSIRLRLFSLLLCTTTLAACASPERESRSDNTLHKAFAEASVSSHRSAKNIARNQYRHPVETLAFFDVRAGMSVMEITPGGMWYAEILAPALKGRGRYIAAGYDSSVEGQPDYRYRQQQQLEQSIIEKPNLYGEMELVKFSPPQSIALGEPATVDRVLTFRNTHNWLRGGYADKVYTAFFEVLKPGGALGVVQHRAPQQQGEDPKRGYISEATIVAVAENAGFVLEARSEINANPKDSADHTNGVWTLPPILRMGEQDREKYLAIGESDRMTLLFRKPQ